MREPSRRLALLRLQAMLAGMARREAMRALAASLEEERRRSLLAERAAALLAASAPRSGASTGARLADRMRFAGGIAGVAQDAAAARGDALRQAEWQAASLAAAEARSRRIAQLETAASRALEAARSSRAAAAAPALARKLQSKLHKGGAGTPVEFSEG